MARFYFDTDDGDMLLADQVGAEFRDLESARRDAAQALGEMARDTLPKDSQRRTLSVTVRDQSGQQVRRLSISYDEEPPL